MNWAIQDNLDSLVGKTIEGAVQEGKHLVLKMSDGESYRVCAMHEFETSDFYVDKQVEVAFEELKESEPETIDGILWFDETL